MKDNDRTAPNERPSAPIPGDPFPWQPESTPAAGSVPDPEDAVDLYPIDLGGGD